ncbi:DUF3861 domain-containing protein [Hymenobacter lucidus]|uniref:DUF3861 domain-containing protein n=1 Tax=Hymenobacter lucidus TaxID=2880930 RepID=A0ABS8AQB4_9BACT|nr:DUF3861 domain-containing protein [Hymenobacter lucidus]MCB2408405.1 DUF3861 domain-containing protein [Hymenobacter lucidus]
MSKRAYKYRLRLEQVAGIQPDSPQHEPLELVFDNHDDIFRIIERMQERNPFQEPGQATEFAIGLKLFSEVLLRNRQHPLFEELGPAFKLFMQRLKAS